MTDGEQCKLQICVTRREKCDQLERKCLDNEKTIQHLQATITLQAERNWQIELKNEEQRDETHRVEEECLRLRELLCHSNEKNRQLQERYLKYKLKLGQTYTFQATNNLACSIYQRNFEVWLSNGDSNTDMCREDNSFIIITGLAGKGITFKSTKSPGQFMRHRDWLCYVDTDDGSDAFKQDATFIPISGLDNAENTVSFQCVNYPDYFLGHADFRVSINKHEDDEIFNATLSWLVVPDNEHTYENCLQKLEERNMHLEEESTKDKNTIIHLQGELIALQKKKLNECKEITDKEFQMNQDVTEDYNIQLVPRVFSGSLDTHTSEVNNRRQCLHSMSCQSDQDNDAHQCSVLNEKDLNFISQRIGESWKDIVRSLDMPEYFIEQIDLDHSHARVAERAYQGLVKTMHQSIKPPANCWLTEILSFIGRHDIIEDYYNKFEIQNPSQNEETLQATEAKIYVREKDIEKIRIFCDDSWTKNRLCIVTALPGNGKWESITAAIRSSSKNKVITPNFSHYWIGRRITFVEFLKIIRESWKANINSKLSSEEDMWDAIRKESKPRILFFDFSGLFFDPQTKTLVWNFLRRVVRYGSSLKIIVASCLLQPYLLHVNTLELIVLRSLREEESVRYLKSRNPNINRWHCKALHACTGGNLYLLQYIDYKIKTFEDFHDELDDLIANIREDMIRRDYVHRLVKDTTWSLRMTSILDELDECERILLAKVVSFTCCIPISSLSVIYNDFTTSPECAEMYAHHLILDRDDDGKNYRISSLTRCLIMTYIQKNDRLYTAPDGKEYTLASISAWSQTKIRMFFLELLVHLAQIFHSKSLSSSYGDCSNLINDFRVSENPNNKCSNYIMARRIFQKHDLSIQRDVLQVHYNFFIPDILLRAPAEILLFLRNMIPRRELQALQRSECCITNTSNKRHLALSLAVYALLKKVTGRDVTLSNTLNNCIDVLEKSINTSPGYREMVLLCYLKRAEINTNTDQHRADVDHDLKRAKNICESKEIGNVAKMEYHKTNAKVALAFEEFDVAKQHCEIFVNSSVDLLGDHPCTVKAYTLLAKAHEAAHTSPTESYYKMAEKIWVSFKIEAERYDVYVNEKKWQCNKCE